MMRPPQARPRSSRCAAESRRGWRWRSCPAAFMNWSNYKPGRGKDMAALDSHEQEQVEALKAWWKANGTQTLIAIALAAAVGLAVLGWKAWHNKQNAKAA